MACSRRLLLGTLAIGLAACQPFATGTFQTFSWGPQPPPPPPPPVVAGPCPPRMLQQAQYLMANLARVRLGSSRLEVISKLGQPGHVESYELNNGAMVEVLYYQTLNTICRRATNPRGAARLESGLLPFVFQDDRLLGYGQHYYHDFLLPKLATLTAPTPTPDQAASPPALMRSNPSPGRMTQEDLPGSTPAPAPRRSIYQSRLQNIAPAAGPDDNADNIGVGDPLR